MATDTTHCPDCAGARWIQASAYAAGQNTYPCATCNPSGAAGMWQEPEPDEEAPQVQHLTVAARDLCRGDVVGSGETVVSVSAGIRAPRGKVEVALDRRRGSRLATWNAGTRIGVTREVAS